MRRRLPFLVALLLSAAPLLAQPNPASRSGFPFDISGTVQTAVTDHPAVADLGLTAGWKSIVFGTKDGRLFVVTYNGSTASVAPGFPKQLPAEIDSPPAIGDVNGDGVPDIVVGYGTNPASGPATPGGICAFRRDGTPIWAGSGCRALDGNVGGRGFPNAVVGSPAIGDVDGDGLNDVAFGAFTGYVYLVNGNTGADKPGWPVDVQDTVWSSPALFDIDSDGRKDVIIGVDAHTDSGRVPPTVEGGYLHVLKYNGSELPGFPFHTQDIVMSAPAVADINGDGKPEIVFGTGTYYYQATGGAVVDHHVYALRCDGSAAPNWPVTVEGVVSTAPAIATFGGVTAVVVTDGPQSPSTTYHVYAFNGSSGAQLFKTQVHDYFGCSQSAKDPIVADVLGDGNLEILVPTNTELAAFSSLGVQLTCFSGSCPSLPASCTGKSTFYTDWTLSGGWAGSLKTGPTTSDAVDVVAVSMTPFVGSGSPTTIRVSVWNPAGKTWAASGAPWPMFHQDPARSGVVPGSPSCTTVTGPLSFHTLTPCRALDTRNTTLTLGAGATLSTQLNGVCGIPSTARAVSLNVTSVAPSAPGYLTLFPGGSAPPTTSTVNMKVGKVRANNAMVGVSADGNATLSILNGSAAAADVIVDVNGYFR